VAEEAVEQDQMLVMAEPLPQTGQMFHREQATPTHKQVVRVVQENNFQRFRELVQMMKMQHRVQVFLAEEQVVVE
tara:strand:- start:209 stop:433 length:225 start_codon:yes stop_codon:yes gene_type:complete